MTTSDTFAHAVVRRIKSVFALQLCAFRYPGRLLKPGEVIPDEVARFLAAQLGLKPDDLLPYAAREKTRREHLGSLRKIYGYKMFNGKRVKQMRSWLDQHAEDAQSSEGMVRGFVGRMSQATDYSARADGYRKALCRCARCRRTADRYPDCCPPRQCNAPLPR